MQLTEEQKKAVAEWIAAGAKLSEVQQRLTEEFGIRLTYMEARLLVDDLSLVPREKEESRSEEKKADDEAGAAVTGEGAGAAKGGVRVSVDQIVKPGAMLSGSVTFSDGVTAEWYIDGLGQFGLVPPTKGYRPKQEDLVAFREQLERELARQGL